MVMTLVKISKQQTIIVKTLLEIAMTPPFTPCYSIMGRERLQQAPPWLSVNYPLLIAKSRASTKLPRQTEARW